MTDKQCIVDNLDDPDNYCVDCGSFTNYRDDTGICEGCEAYDLQNGICRDIEKLLTKHTTTEVYDMYEYLKNTKYINNTYISVKFGYLRLTLFVSLRINGEVIQNREICPEDYNYCKRCGEFTGKFTTSLGVCKSCKNERDKTLLDWL